MNPRPLFDLPKIINGINKTLGMLNKAIPLYQQVKPILNNATSLNNILNMIKKDDDNKIIKKEPNKKIKKVSNNLPTFFQ